jgi:hypothetical protein
MKRLAGGLIWHCKHGPGKQTEYINQISFLSNPAQGRRRNEVFFET